MYQSQQGMISKVEGLERSIGLLQTSNQELRRETEALKQSVSRLEGFQELLPELTSSDNNIKQELQRINESVNRPVESRVSRLEFSGNAGLVQCIKAKCPDNSTAFNGKCMTNSQGLELKGFGLASGRNMENYNYWECCYAVKEGADGTHSFDVEVYCK